MVRPISALYMAFATPVPPHTHHFGGSAIFGAASSITEAEREQRLFLEGAADQLQAERQALRRGSGRHGDARQAGHVHRHGEDVVQIHFDRIGGALLADAEGGRRRRRRQDRIDAIGEGRLEIALDQVRIFCART